MIYNLKISALFFIVLFIGCNAELKSPQDRSGINSSDKTLTVMLYNIHHAEGMDGKLSTDRIATIIKESNADVIALNEVDNQYGKRSNFQYQTKIIAEKIGMNYYFGPAIKKKDPFREYGNAILSRFEFRQQSNHPLPNNEKCEPRACISAVVKVGDQDIRVFVTHLDHKSDSLINKQIGYVQELASSESNLPVLIMGDFNEEIFSQKDPSKEWVSLQTNYTSAFKVAGVGPVGTCLGNENKKIDFIFISSRFSDAVEDCYVFRNEITNQASDHWPLIAHINLDKLKNDFQRTDETMSKEGVSKRIR
ncbi:MAG: endonuclease/exonuclease/phosphatase family protein [Planctomycetes bacterium]|nr:endonuclease/exonuclease/phosphatase family protein [Planctomycetota bacterium]